LLLVDEDKRVVSMVFRSIWRKTAQARRSGTCAASHLAAAETVLETSGRKAWRPPRRRGGAPGGRSGGGRS
jgi:hypothetical protein